MIKFIKFTALYLTILIISLILIIASLSNIVKKRDFKNHQTESNLLIMKSNEKFDILIMGISHARNFSRYKNHLRVENILNKKIINIGQGGGSCGINEQLFYLDYFYHKENEASTVVYILSPPLLFSETLPYASNTFDYEPFEFDFLFRYLLFSSTNKKERIFSYLQTKFRRNWFFYRPHSLDSKDDKLDSINNYAVIKGQQMVYNDSLSLNRFNKSKLRIKETIHLALGNNSNVVLIIPPAIFGRWKGHENVARFAREMQGIEGVEFYDFSESVLSKEYYYDHHHLNTDGIVFFTKKYLNPILNPPNKLTKVYEQYK